MSLAFTISDLRQQPELFDSVADRIWLAWWEPNGYPLAYIEERLKENLQDTPIPLALVAHHGSTFLGTASVIACDLDERPHLTPWVAAVWVEESARGHGIGAAGFYQRLGWTPVERRVGPYQFNVFVREASSPP